jgi:hypothetical protein
MPSSSIAMSFKPEAQIAGQRQERVVADRLGGDHIPVFRDRHQRW